MKSRGTIIGLAVLASALLPAWTVKTASTDSRIFWSGAVLFVALVSIIGALARYGRLTSDWDVGAHWNRRREWVVRLAAALCIVAGFLSVAFTYATPGVGIFGRLGTYVATAGALVVPVVARYATDLSPPLPPDSLFLVQAIVSVWMFAATLIAVAYMALICSLPAAERRDMHKWTRKWNPKPLSGWTAGLFVLLILPMAFLGWGEFDGTDTEHCLVRAVCYARGDDLLIFAAALAKALIIILVTIGAALIVDQYVLLSDDEPSPR